MDNSLSNTNNPLSGNSPAPTVPPPPSSTAPQQTSPTIQPTSGGMDMGTLAGGGGASAIQRRFQEMARSLGPWQPKMGATATPDPNAPIPVPTMPNTTLTVPGAPGVNNLQGLIDFMGVSTPESQAVKKAMEQAGVFQTFAPYLGPPPTEMTPFTQYDPSGLLTALQGAGIVSAAGPTGTGATSGGGVGQPPMLEQWLQQYVNNYKTGAGPSPVKGPEQVNVGSEVFLPWVQQTFGPSPAQPPTQPPTAPPEAPAQSPYGDNGTLGMEDLGNPNLSQTDQQVLAGQGYVDAYKNYLANPNDAQFLAAAKKAWLNAQAWGVPGVPGTFALAGSPAGSAAANPAYGANSTLGLEDLGAPGLSLIDQLNLAGQGYSANPGDAGAYGNYKNWIDTLVQMGLIQPSAIQMPTPPGRGGTTPA